MKNFDTAREVLEVSSNSAGSAMNEHAKWSESLEGHLLRLKAAWQDFALTFMNSDFLKGSIDFLKDFVNIIEKIVKSFGTLGTIGLGVGVFSVLKHLKDFRNLFSIFQAISPELRSVKGLFQDLGRTFMKTPAGIGLTVAAIGLAINAFKNYKEAQAEARRETIETSNAFLDSVSSFEQVYIKYSGRTSLSAEEESELASAVDGTVSALGEKSSALQDVVTNSDNYLDSLEKIAKKELEVSHRKATDKLDAAKEELNEISKGWFNIDGSEVDTLIDSGLQDNNEEIIKAAKEIGEKYYNSLNIGNEGYSEFGFELSTDASVEEIVDFYNVLVDYRDKLKELEKSGDIDLEDKSIKYAYDNTTASIEKMSGAVETYIDALYDVSKLEYEYTQNKGIPKTVEEYMEMRDSILKDLKEDNASFDVRYDIANKLDSEYGQMFDLSSIEIKTKKFKDIISGFGNGTVDGSNEIGTIETFLNMKTAVNNNECSVGNYLSSLKEVQEMSDGFSEKEREAFNLEFDIDDDTIKKQYDKLSDDYIRSFGKGIVNTKDEVRKEFEKGFLDGLTAEELHALYIISPEIDWANDPKEEILNKMDEQVEVQKVLSFTIDLEIEKGKLESLSTAISESVSGSGLSTTSITAIEDIFGKLDSYDPSKLFERTANGIRLNTDELRKMNTEYKNTNIDGLDKKMSTLGDEYNRTREELSNLTYGTEEYNSKLGELNNIESEIKALEQLATGYEGLASAYQTWQMAESAGNQRDMYESVIGGFKTVEDELKRGWIDDSTVEFLKLIKGEKATIIDGDGVAKEIDIATASASELNQVLDDMDKIIEHTAEGASKGYSIKDFFTVDENGNSTSKGVFNFLDAVGHMEEEVFKGIDVVERDTETGNIIGFDFELVGGNKAIADAMGVSEELVDIMVRAADDAGFVVSMDGTYQQLDVLKEKAQDAANELKNTFKVTDYEFDLSTDKVTGEGSITEQYQEALNIWSEFSKNKNVDGTINMEVDGAEEAFTLVSTLQSMVDKLSEPAYMELDTSQVEKDMRTPLSKLQEYERLTKQENQLRLKGTDTSEIDKSQEEILDYFEGLSPEIKAELGIENLSREELQAKVEAGEIEIPATVDLQVEMNNTLKDMVNVALYNAGLIDEEELEKRVDIKLYANTVDTSDAKEKTDEAVNNLENEDSESFVVEQKTDVKLETNDVEFAPFTPVEDDIPEFAPFTPIEQKTDVKLETNDVEFAPFTPVEEIKSEVGVPVVEQKTDLIFEVGEVDDSDIVKTVDSLDDIVAANQGTGVTIEKNLKIIAKVLGAENVEDLYTKLGNLDDKTVEAIVDVIGRTDLDSLKQTMATLDPVKVQAIVEALGKGDVDGLIIAMSQLEPKQVDAIARAFGYEDVGSLYGAISQLDSKTVQAVAEALGITDVDSLKGAIDRVYDKDVTVTATTEGKSLIDSLKNTIDGIQSKTVTITTIAQKIGDFFTGGANGTANINGTAFANGTINKSGRAYKQGDWGTKDSGTALMGELGRETIVRDGRFFTVGDNGAGFYKYKKGDIIFNHKQTEELFKNGKVTSGGGRGRALVTGTAFDNGTTDWNPWGNNASTSSNSSKSSSTPKYNSSPKYSSTDPKYSSTDTTKDKEEAKDFLETIDWIEIKIERLERAIDRLDTQASSTWRSWTLRNNALVNEIAKVEDEISLQEKAYDKYMKKAKSVAIGLDGKYINQVNNGTLKIEDIKNEKTAEKIKEYQEWYEKALECKDAILELQDTEAELWRHRFDNIASEYDGIIQGYDHTESMLNEYISRAEEKGHIVSKQYYDALIKNEKANISELKAKQRDLIHMRDTAVDSGAIKKSSEEWYDMCSEIDAVTQEIESANTELIEFANKAEEANKALYELTQNRFSRIADESNFLIELMSYDKLHDDNGKLTNEGMATMGLHAQNQNTYMYKADEALTEAKRLKKLLKKDPFDTELEEAYNDAIAEQYDYILKAKQEEQEMIDLIEEGIQIELDGLQERIDKYEESLDSVKDLYEYNKKITEQTKNIGNLRKELSAYEGDDSEEARAKIQELKLELSKAEDELKDSEYERFISDQTALLDDLYLQYETILNERLDNQDALLQQIIDSVNASAIGEDNAISNSTQTIDKTIKDKVNELGVTLSDSMKSIWSVEGNGNKVVTKYGEKFNTKLTTVNTTLNSIKTGVSNMVTALNKEASTKTSTNKTSSSSKKDPTTNKTTSTTKTSTTSNKPSNKPSGDGKPEVGDKVTFVSGKYYYDSAGTKPNGSKYKGKQVYITRIKNTANYKYHISTGKKLGDGNLGWVKLSQLSGYEAGKKNFLDDEIAWTQENNREFIVRPSDGAILTPIAKGDSVLNASASRNIWDLANSPTEFIKNNLGLDNTGIPSGTNVHNSYSQHIDNVIFKMDNVKNYDEMLKQMQKDKSFEKLVIAMTIDRITGGSSLAKNKAIR